MKKPLKILFISQYFPPEMGAPSARTFELCRHWVKSGHKVTVITGFPHHPTGVIPPEYKQHFYKLENVEGIEIIRTYVYATANKGFFKRILSYLSFMFSAIVLGPWKSGKPDVVIATSPQFFVAIAGYLVSLIKRRPFVFEVRDLWPESIVQLGQLKNKWLIKFLESIEVFLYQRASMIVSVTDSFVPIIARKGIDKGKIVVIKNGVDLELFNPDKSHPELKKDLHLQGKFIVSYIGTHGLSHALDKVLETAAILRDNPEIHFLFVGEGAEKENLIKQKALLQLSNVTFLDQIDKADLPYYYNLSDIVLITLRDLALFRTVIPSKMFEIMAMARPIIISVDGEARKIVADEAGAGIYVEPENPHQLREAILSLYRDALKRSQLGQNGRIFVEKYYNRQVLANRYIVALRKNIFHSNE
jgi:glycosyltransferase involved in cell wall biosynthesis